MSIPEDRRFQPRRAVDLRAVVITEGRELASLIVDASEDGLRLRLDRQITLTTAVIVIDVTRATAFEARVIWQKGMEAGVKIGAGTGLRGLVPARLAAARQAWVRASTG
jgi:hypothetical protein